MLPCPSCDPSIALGLTHVSMGTFVVPDNGVDCLNGCQTFDLGYEQVNPNPNPNPKQNPNPNPNLGYAQRSDDYLMGGHIINAPRKDGNQDGKRLGLETPAWYRLACG